MKRFALPLLFAISTLPLSVYGGVSFDFEAEKFPVKALFGYPQEATEGRGNATLEKVEKNGKTVTVAKVTGEGVSIKAATNDPQLGELSSVTISTTFRTEEAVSTPVYWQRIDRSSSNIGYLSFHSQHNYGDTGSRKGTFRLILTNEAGSNTVSSSEPWVLRANQWHSVAMVFDHGMVRFYLDGNLVGTPVQAPAKLIPSLAEGKGGVRAGRGFTGEIDDLVILPNRALDDQQIKALHEEGTGSETVRAFLNQ